MANPARKPPTGTTIDTADILAAISDLGDRMERRFSKVEADIAKIDDRQRKVENDVSEMKGRLTGIEGQLRQIPTVWTISALIFTIFGASFALIRYAMGH